MNSEIIELSRNLLLNLNEDDVISTQYNHDNNTRIGFDKYPPTVIEWLVEAKLLVLVDVISISINSTIEVFKKTDLGKQLINFSLLAKLYSGSVYDIVTENEFLSTVECITRVLQSYSNVEIEPLTNLLTHEEQLAYSQYETYRRSNEDSNKAPNIKPNVDLLDDKISNMVWEHLNPMFEMSTLLGEKGTDETRTNNYVFKKCMEELGEMALEDQIENGLSYKEPGTDGVAGEAVDLAICAMDMFALQHPGHSAKEITALFLVYMNKKLEKWKQTISLK